MLVDESKFLLFKLRVENACSSITEAVDRALFSTTKKSTPEQYEFDFKRLYQKPTVCLQFFHEYSIFLKQGTEDKVGLHLIENMPGWIET
jgi:lantibiotic modifying enzyme